VSETVGDDERGKREHWLLRLRSFTGQTAPSTIQNLRIAQACRAPLVHTNGIQTFPPGSSEFFALRKRCSFTQILLLPCRLVMPGGSAADSSFESDGEGTSPVKKVRPHVSTWLHMLIA
jgi:hypothetical protein